MKLLFHGGKIVDPSQGIEKVADLLVDRRRVIGVGKMKVRKTWEVVEARGLIVAPGFIDMHVHLREPGREDKETILTGCQAAAAGGFTSVACMPNTQPVNDNEAITRFILERARQADLVNVFPVGAISRGLAGEEMAEIGAMCRAGVVAVSDDGNGVQNHQLMRRVFEYTKLFGIPVIDHCEDQSLASGGAMNESSMSTRLGLRGISRTAEELHVARDIMLGRITGGRVHIAHVSTRESIWHIREGKKQGVSVTCEATPHHFTLTDRGIHNYDTNYKMNPPLREPEDVEAVLEGLADGAVDCIATDHAPHTRIEKDATFEEAANGIIGLETAVPLMWERLLRSGRISLSRLVELCSLNPSRILRLERGTLQEGAVADVTVIDPDVEVTIDVESFKSKSRNSPFHGWVLHGAPVLTVVGGRIVHRLVYNK
jgi:dihydroorotase